MAGVPGPGVDGPGVFGTGTGADAFHEREGELWCEGVALTRLVAEFGTPCYVYSAGALRARYRAFRAAFEGTDASIFYSVKANANLGLLGLLHELGAGVDVVSAGELYRARLAGFEGGRILFGGVGKRADELAAALEAGVLLVNVESAAELEALDAAAAEHGVRAPVAIRVNPAIQAATHSYTQTGHYRTKFGVAYEEAADLYARAAALDHVDALGLDVHIGSQILSHEPYEQAIDRLTRLAAEIRGRGLELRYLDIGGGFGVPHERGPELELAAVAEAVGRAAERLGVTVLLEPGRWLVGPTGLLLARVLYPKRLGDRLYYITDAGSNDFLRPSYYSAYHPIEPVRRRPPEVTADVVGPVCETGDFLGRECSLPELEKDELLAVGYAGAYGFVMSSNYNSRPRAAEVLVDGESARLVRRRETLDDLVAPERLDSEPR